MDAKRAIEFFDQLSNFDRPIRSRVDGELMASIQADTISHVLIGLGYDAPSQDEIAKELQCDV